MRQPASAKESEEGTITGTVFFSGVPCPADRLRVPPCDGPYPDYEVVLYKSDGATAVARMRTGAEGVYEVSVPPGTYVIYSQAIGFSGKMEEIPNTVAVEAGKAIRFNFSIDTGIR
jgi:hypothetical protein